MFVPARLIRVLGAMSLVASLLAGAFGVSSVAAQAPEDPFGPVVGAPGVYFPWVANDDESTGLGPADTSITIQNLDATDATIYVYRGIGTSGLGGDNGWELIGPLTLEAHASKTFSAAQLGIAAGEGAPIAVVGYTFTGEIDAGFIEDYNQDGDSNDYETIAEEDFPYDSGANSWLNTSPAEEVSWSDGDCLVVDIDPNLSDPDSPIINVYPAGYDDGGAPGIPGGTYPGQPGGNLDGNAANCTITEAGDASDVIAPSNLGGVAKQAVDGENLPYTSEVDMVVSGYTGLAGWELVEVGNESGPYNGWYLPVVQTNGGPGGAWNSIIRVANFGDGGGTIGAAGVVVTFYPADDAAGELNTSFSVNLNINAGETQAIDLSSRVPEGWIGSAHISSDAPVFAMVDRVKVGYNMWLTNTASNAVITAENNPWGDGSKFVLFAPDVRKDFFGWNTGINVANLADQDNTVTIQYLGDIGTANQATALHSKGMTYFYDPSQAPQDNNQQDPTTDPNANSGEIGAAILMADYPIAAAIDATKYPESTSSSDPNIFQGLSYSATHNLWFDQAVPLVQKGNPDTGMGATSGIQLFNPLDVSSQATVTWFMTSGDTAGNPIPVVINPNAMTFVYTMTDQQLSVGFLGSATIDASSPIAVVSTQVDYQVQFDGSAVWNGYNPAGASRDQGPVPASIMDGIVTLIPVDTPVPMSSQASLQQVDGVPAAGVLVNVYADGDCPTGEVLFHGTTDENGEVEIPVDPGTYSVGTDPNNDGDVSCVDGIVVEPGDTNLDVDFTITEQAVVGIADVLVDDTQCDVQGSPVPCDALENETATTAVFIVPVDSLNVLCRDADYSVPPAFSMVYDGSEDSFTLPVGAPGLYCAMADMDGDLGTIDRIYSVKPFAITSNDPSDDTDDHLVPLATLDVQVRGYFGEGGEQPLADIQVEIFEAAGGDSETACAGTSLGVFTTDADGIVSIPVMPGDYCAEANPNKDHISANDQTDVSGTTIVLGDPSFADNGDIDLELVEAAAWLSIETRINGVNTTTPISVEVFLGSGIVGGECEGMSLGTFSTDDTGHLELLVAPLVYCAEADPLEDSVVAAAATSAPLLIGDPKGDEDILINEDAGTLDVAVTLNSNPLTDPVSVEIFRGSGTDATTGLCTGDSLGSFDTGAAGQSGSGVGPGTLEMLVGVGDYCAQADPSGDGVLTAATGTVEIGDSASDGDITINEDEGILNITVTINGEGFPGLVGVELFDGGLGSDGLCEGESRGFLSANKGIAATEVPAGEYCAQSDPDEKDGPTAATGTVTPGDPNNPDDPEITIDESRGVLNITVTLNGEELTGLATVKLFSGGLGANNLCEGMLLTETPLSAPNGIVATEVKAGDYCAQSDPNGNGTPTAATGTVAPADPNDAGDPEITINETIGVADIIVPGMLCAEDENTDGFPDSTDRAACEGSFDLVMTSVRLVPVASDADCSAQDYSGGIPTIWDAAGDGDPLTSAFEQLVEAGYYCAQADLEGIIDDLDPELITSPSPFEITVDDPETDNNDETLALAVLDIDATLAGGPSGTSVENWPIEIYLGDTSVEGVDHGEQCTAFGDREPDHRIYANSEGHAQKTVNLPPNGMLCAQLVVVTGDLANTYTDSEAEVITLPPGDPDDPPGNADVNLDVLLVLFVDQR